MNYTTEQYVEMVLLYGECNRNGRQAARQYALKFPNERHPSAQTILDAVRRLKENGSFEFPSRSRKSKIHVSDEEVLGYVLAYPQSSVKDVSEACGCSKTYVWNILNLYGAHPYRPQLVQDLMVGDENRRFDFCNFILNMLDGDPSFLNDILWTDECQFTRGGVVNRWNTHLWALQNPHATRPNKYQIRWSVNVWCGIWKGVLIGPFFIDGTLTGNKYTDLLSGPITDFIDEHVSLADVRKMWYQHDGAPAHKATNSHTILRSMFRSKIIGYGGQVEWPPRSPDLNPLDFFLWGYLKNKVYVTDPVSITDLQNRILVAARCVTPTVLKKVSEEFESRVRLCTLVEGRHFEQLL